MLTTQILLNAKHFVDMLVFLIRKFEYLVIRPRLSWHAVGLGVEFRLSHRNFFQCK